MKLLKFPESGKSLGDRLLHGLGVLIGLLMCLVAIVFMVSLIVGMLGGKL